MTGQHEPAETDALRRELSLARAWAWAEYHRMWAYRWFPEDWVPRPQEEWRVPDWLSTSVQPDRQDWFVDPRSPSPPTEPERPAGGEGTPRERCPECGTAGQYGERTKPKVVEREGRVAVVTGVPVTACDACGQTWLATAVAVRLDELFDAALAHNELTVRPFTAPLTPELTGVRVLHDHVLEVSFADGVSGPYDFAGKLAGPVFAPLREDYELFCAVRVSPEAGTIVWPVGDDPDQWPDWAPDELYDHIVRSKR